MKPKTIHLHNPDTNIVYCQSTGINPRWTIILEEVTCKKCNRKLDNTKTISHLQMDTWKDKITG